MLGIQMMGISYIISLLPLSKTIVPDIDFYGKFAK